MLRSEQCVQRPAVAAGKGLALVVLRPEAFKDQINRRGALLHSRVGSIQNDYGPRTAGTQRNSCTTARSLGEVS
jgi:hypothetical protein